jgi:hypothetical protein
MVDTRFFLFLNYAQALVAMCVLVLCGCGKADYATERTPKNSFNGTWQVRYEVLVDECKLLSKNDTVFQDTQQILQTEQSISLVSGNLSQNEYLGELRNKGYFETSTHQTGDLFRDGVNCTAEEALAYSLPEADLKIESTFVEAASLYDLRLKCDDGFYCVSALRGTAIKDL